LLGRKIGLAFSCFKVHRNPTADLTVNSSAATPDSSATVDHHRWFAEEVQPHASQLKAYVRGAFPAVRDVDDIVQESYLRIWKTRATHPIQSAKAFLFTVARHVALNFLQRQRSSPVIAVVDLSPLPVCEDSPGGYEALSRNEKRQLLVAALATLPPRCREITVLRKLQGIPQRDVAAALGLSERTVEEQVARGVRRCEDYLRRRGVNSYYDR
jgi:RNA polymerase sigma-70 factor (ECF subfamily)